METDKRFSKRRRARRMLFLWCAALIFVGSGCWAPLRSHGIPASSLPDSFRMPIRTAGPPLNFSRLTVKPPADYRLGPGDSLDVTIPGLYERAEIAPMRVQVMASGEVHLPLVGAVTVQNLNLLQAQRKVNEAYADGFLNNPRVNVALAEKSTTTVLVLGEVNLPGLHALPKYENDIGHALAAAGGLTEDASELIEVHRHVGAAIGRSTAMTRLPPLSVMENSHFKSEAVHAAWAEDPHTGVQRVALRGPDANMLTPQDVILQPGDVVVAPSRKHEVFYVVGKLSQTNTVRFTVGDRERELGVGFILPRDRELDVVTAVTMAGYIDPIDSPTTVTVHRIMADGEPLLINVDLIKARYDRTETVLVQPGDIIYLNPDFPWWFRRTFDRVIPDLLLLPYARLVDPL